MEPCGINYRELRQEQKLKLVGQLPHNVMDLSKGLPLMTYAQLLPVELHLT